MVAASCHHEEFQGEVDFFFFLAFWAILLGTNQAPPLSQRWVLNKLNGQSLSSKTLRFVQLTELLRRSGWKDVRRLIALLCMCKGQLDLRGGAGFTKKGGRACLPEKGKLNSISQPWKMSQPARLHHHFHMVIQGKLYLLQLKKQNKNKKTQGKTQVKSMAHGVDCLQ